MRRSSELRHLSRDVQLQSVRVPGSQRDRDENGLEFTVYLVDSVLARPPAARECPPPRRGCRPALPRPVAFRPEEGARRAGGGRGGGGEEEGRRREGRRRGGGPEEGRRRMRLPGPSAATTARGGALSAWRPAQEAPHVSPYLPISPQVVHGVQTTLRSERRYKHFQLLHQLLLKEFATLMPQVR